MVDYYNIFTKSKSHTDYFIYILETLSKLSKDADIKKRATKLGYLLDGDINLYNDINEKMNFIFQGNITTESLEDLAKSLDLLFGYFER